MAVYFIVIILTLIFGYQAQSADIREGVRIDDNGRVHHSSNAKLYFIIISILLICVAGLRYDVGADFFGYYDYAKYAKSFLDRLTSLDEPGYSFICKITELIYPQGGVAVFLASLITIGLSLSTIFKYTDKLFLSLMLFLFLGFWHGSFNGVRQFLAASILFCGYPFLKNGKFLKYLIFVLLAFLFHRSAIVMILPYFVIRREVNIKNLFILIIVTAIGFYSSDRFFAISNMVLDKQSSFTNAYATHAINILRVFVSIAPLVLFIPPWLGKTDKEHDFYINILVMSSSLNIMTMNSALLNRIYIYTILLQAMAIPKLLDVFMDKTKRTIVICMLILYGIFWLYELWNSTSLNNFMWIWQQGGQG